MCIIIRVNRSVCLGPLGRLLAGRSMDRLLEIALEKLVIWGALLGMAIATAIYVVRKIRAESVQQEPAASDLISKFRELHSRGDLSDEEFRTIKTKLAAQLQDELRDTDEKG